MLRDEPGVSTLVSTPGGLREGSDSGEQTLRGMKTPFKMLRPLNGPPQRIPPKTPRENSARHYQTWHERGGIDLKREEVQEPASRGRNFS